jgi:hypothetical protein
MVEVTHFIFAGDPEASSAWAGRGSTTTFRHRASMNVALAVQSKPKVTLPLLLRRAPERHGRDVRRRRVAPDGVLGCTGAAVGWERPLTEVLDWSEARVAKWLVGRRLNVAYNCVGLHVEAGNGDRVAIRWVGEPVDDERTIRRYC